MIQQKTKVITTVAAWPEALPVMKAQLDKHLKEPFEFICFVDTPSKPGPYNLWNRNLRARATEIASQVTDQVFTVPEELHDERRIQFPATSEKRGKNANTRAADTLQYAWNQVIRDSKGAVLILDNDMFPVGDFNTATVLSGNPIAGIYSISPGKNTVENIDWIWSGLLFLDPGKMPVKELWSFDCGKVNNVRVDVSGQTHIWLNQAQKLGVEPQWLPHLSSLNWGIHDLNSKLSTKILNFMLHDDRNIDDKFYSELYDNKFIHFRAGSNWKKEPAEIVKRRNQDFLSAMIGES
jgi:hypothetical protein